MMSTGTIAMIVDAIPVLVSCTASSEKETPRKGPKKAPIESWKTALWLEIAFQVSRHLPRMVNRMANPVIPAITRICADAKGL